MMRACALVLRDKMALREVETRPKVRRKHARQVHYLSLEFLMGRRPDEERLQPGGPAPAAGGPGRLGLQGGGHL